jgi:hypothetical protein
LQSCAPKLNRYQPRQFRYIRGLSIGFDCANDILNKGPRAFLTWDIIAETMSPPAYARFARTELRFLRSNGWTKRLSNANAIHQSYHLCRFEIETAVKVQEFGFVLEFGGGYGEMRRIVHEIGFRGRYVIFDLPEFNALQRYYLRASGDPPALATSDLLEVQAVVEAGINSSKLFIATSFDETPLETRFAWGKLLSDFDAFLIAYQADFAGIDNQAFFADWQKRFPHIRWSTQPIPQLKDSFYLFGFASEG